MNSGSRSVGAATEKAQSQGNFKQDRGTVKSKFWDDADDVETGKETACLLYSEAWLCNALYTDINTLYWIL